MISSLGRYLDTASMALAARNGSLSLAAPLSMAPKGICRDVSLPSGMAIFYAPNATLAMFSIIEQRVLYAGCGWRGCSLHPVVRSVLGPLRQDATIGGMVHIRTLTDWISGEQCDLGTILSLDSSPSDLLIIDAVQSFGTLTLEELSVLLKAVRGGAVVVGCLHKWLGSPVPLGFAILSNQLLESAAGLRAHLAARDYLGFSLGPREGFDSFPDTYTATLTPIFSPLLRIAFGLDSENLKRGYEIIVRNRGLLAHAILQNPRLRIVETACVCRAIVAAYAPSETAERISDCLLQAGFVHTLFREHPASGRATLRLSAPLVEIDEDSCRLLQSILAS